MRTFLQNIYTTRREIINRHSVTIAEPTPLQRLTAILDELGKNRIVFKDSIVIAATKGTAVMRVLQINRYPMGSMAYVEVYNDRFMISVDELPAHVLEGVIGRLKLEYGGELK